MSELIKLLEEVYDVYGPGGMPRAKDAPPEPVGAWVVEKTPVDVYARLTAAEIDHNWDFEERHLMHKVAKAIVASKHEATNEIWNER